MAVTEQTGNQSVDSSLSILNSINFNNIKPEGMADATSLTISFAYLAASQAKDLPPSQQAAVANQINQAMVNVAGATSSVGGGTELTEEEKRKKQYQETVELNQGNPKPLAEQLKEQLEAKGKGDLAKEVEAFSKLYDVVQNSSELMPFEKKAELVKAVMNPNEAAAYLKRDVEVNGVHQILTNYIGNEPTMPDLSKGMIDNFCDKDKNRAHAAQSAKLAEDLKAQKDELVKNGQDPNDVDKLIKESKNTQTVATAAVSKEEVKQELLGLSSESRKNEKESGVVTEDTGRATLAKIRATKEAKQNKTGTGKDKEQTVPNFPNRNSGMGSSLTDQARNVGKSSGISGVSEASTAKKEVGGGKPPKTGEDIHL